ncbi:hypothetical protein Esti_001871 [Eimeria stiedai]
MQGGTNHMSGGGGVRELAPGAPVGRGGGPMLFPHGPLMIPPGLPLPLGAAFPGAAPPALLPGAFALHHAAVAGAAAGAAAAAEEAREARERALMNAVNSDGIGGAPGGRIGVSQRGARSGALRGKRHGVERASHSWRRPAHDEAALSAGGSTLSRSHKARGGEWRGRGASHPGGGAAAAARWRAAETGGSSGATNKKRQRLVDRGGPPQNTSDSELSLMSVASDEQQQNRRSPSVEFVSRQKPLDGGPPPPCSAPSADNAGELSAVLTPMSSLSRSSRNSSISRSSSPCEQQFQTARSRVPMDVVGVPVGSNSQTGVGQNDSMPEWPPGLGGPVITSSRLPPADYTRARSPPPPPGFNADNATTSAQHQAGPQHNTAKRSPPKRLGKFLFDLWVPTTFHPLGKDAIKAVLGVRGSTHKEMERVAGAHVQIYGKQLNRSTKKHEYDEFRDNQPLHLVVTSDRLKNPNPTPDEQLQMVHRLQNMLEGLVRENWPSVAPHPPHSFFEKQQCLGPSTGPLVEVEPLTGTCRMVGQPSTSSSPVSAVRPGGPPPAAEEVLHAAAAPLQQRRIEGAPPILREEQGAGPARVLPGVAPQLASVSQPQMLRMPPDVAQQPSQPQAAPWLQQHPSGGAPQQPACLGSNNSTAREVRFRGDPSLLLDLPPPFCLLMLTLQGLHALLAEEGPCSLSALPSRFVQRWEVPFKYYKAEYGLDASCPLSWSDSLLAFVEHFPEVVRVADGDAAWAQGPAAEAKTPTVACVDPPQFRAVAARMHQLLTA